jgi:hypothetical protein
MPSTRSITKNGAPMSSVPVSSHRTRGTGTSVWSATICMVRNWRSMS